MEARKLIPRLLLFVVACGLGMGCEPSFNIVNPTQGSIQEGEVDFEITWDASIDPTDFSASLNGEDITDQFSVTGSGATASFEPLPGKKLFSVLLPKAPLLGGNDTVLFTATSNEPVESFIGGLLSFESESSFFPLPITIPGLDPGLGLTELFSGMLAMVGTFPEGSSQFPVSPPLPFLFGAFPQMLSFDLHPMIPNGIAIEPVEIGLDIPFDPGAEGAICAFALTWRASSSLLKKRSRGPFTRSQRWICMGLAYPLSRGASAWRSSSPSPIF